MKKLVFCIVLIVCALALSGASAGEKTTTLLVYMCGSDIQEDACEDLYEMAGAETGR